MKKEKISVIQLFALMFIFDMGSSVVVSYGINAGKAAWLAILLGMCGGIILFFIYYFLYRQYPTIRFTGYARKIFGKYVGWIIGLLYCLYFLYIAARNVRDLGDLLVSSTLTETPLFAVITSLVLVICYVIYLGTEALGRTAEVFIVILLLLGITGNFFVFVSGEVHIHNLRPFLENGWGPILNTVFPTLIAYPFGQMLVFTMLLPALNRPTLTKKVWLSALICSGLTLAWTSSLNIAVLSIDTAERSTFPTLTTVGKVNLFDFIERLDAIVVFILLITIFFKASILLHCTILGITDLFKLENGKRVVFLLGGILIFLSMVMASNYSEQREEGGYVLDYYLNFPLLIVIPLCMLIISIIRNHIKKKMS
ncbi:GerAB/ArcD/ProY family transporter [Priestia aryabhattai]|uniref:GerAB/ArcD/ProY family transporter n=1 Tax=Priestia aryabhattai TaxID=412384 RepID=UPI0018752A29|nr:GerAB/ArcD/ProY family transporter [Priestia aryabhattai]MBE5102064.1 GerAB/ArcD/ProY family transporter [Priestia aryabhattai]